MNLNLRRLRTPLIFAMVVLLLCVQALGLAHRLAHAPGAARVVAVATEATPTTPATQRSRHWLQALLPEHDSDRSCQLYDQLTHADAAPAAALSVVAVTVHAAPEATHRASCLAAQAAGFLARGPPEQG